LAREMAEGKFREYFYYPLCSDIVITPSLADQLQDASGVLDDLLRFITIKLAGEA